MLKLTLRMSLNLAHRPVDRTCRRQRKRLRKLESDQAERRGREKEPRRAHGEKGGEDGGEKGSEDGGEKGSEDGGEKGGEDGGEKGDEDGGEGGEEGGDEGGDEGTVEGRGDGENGRVEGGERTAVGHNSASWSSRLPFTHCEMDARDLHLYLNFKTYLVLTRKRTLKLTL